MWEAAPLSLFYLIPGSARDARFRLERRLSSSFLQGHPPSLRFGHPDVTTDDTAFPRWGSERVRPRFPDAPSGCQPGRSPMRSEERAERPGDGCPCVGAEEICGASPLEQSNLHKRRTRRPHHLDTDGAFYLRDELLSNAEVSQQERVIPRDFTPTRWSVQIPSARGTKSACGRVYAVGVPQPTW